MENLPYRKQNVIVPAKVVTLKEILQLKFPRLNLGKKPAKVISAYLESYCNFEYVNPHGVRVEYEDDLTFCTGYKLVEDKTADGLAHSLLPDLYCPKAGLIRLLHISSIAGLS